MVRHWRRSVSVSAAERAEKERSWLLEFLERDGLGVLLDSLERLGAVGRRGGKSSMADLTSQVDCVACTRAVINSGVGLEYIVDHPAHTRQLASVLSSNNTTVKLQVFELLCAICMFSASGHALALDALQHFKNLHGYRYRFDAVVMELRAADNPVYQATLLAFVNCLVLANQDLATRVRMRNELVALGLEKVLVSLRRSDSDALQIQVAVFDKSAHVDQDALDEAGAGGDLLHMSHHQLFDVLFAKVADSPQSFALRSVLLHLTQLDPANPQSDRIWEALEELTANIANGGGPASRLRPSQTRSVATQTTPRGRPSDRLSGAAAATDASTDAAVTMPSQEGHNRVDVGTDPMTPSPSPAPTTASRLETQAPVEASSTSTPAVPPPPPPPPFPGAPAPPPPPPPPPFPGAPAPPPPPPPPPFPGAPAPPPPPPFPGAPPPPPFPGAPPPPPFPGAPAAPPPPPFPGAPAPPPPPPVPGAPPPGYEGREPVVEPIFVSKKQYETYPGRPGHNWDATGANKFSTFPLPRKKLRLINWDKIPNQGIGSNSLWAGLQDMEQRVTINFHELEKMFEVRTAAPKPGKKEQVEAVAPAQPQTVNLLDSKRSLSVNIFLKQFRAGTQVLLDAVKEGDPSKLGTGSLERLQSLEKLLPDETELVLIRSHPKDGGPLGDAEQFFLDLANIPSYQVRVQAMLQKELLPLSVQELKPKLKTVVDTCDQLINNASLKEFLALILQFGNFINAGSYAGNAAGFKLVTLPKLLDMRANKPRVTFLHYVVDVLEAQNTDILMFTTEMKQMRSAARISLDTLKGEVTLLETNINNLSKRLKNADKDVQKQFAEFVTEAMETVQDLLKCVSDAEKEAKRLAIHFCEDVNSSSAASKFQLQDCFVRFADFFDKVDQVRVENKQRKKLEERAAARKKAEEERNASKSNAENTKSEGVSGKGRKGRGQTVLVADEPCLVDLLMQEIKGGTFKLRRTIPAGQM